MTVANFTTFSGWVTFCKIINLSTSKTFSLLNNVAIFSKII